MLRWIELVAIIGYCPYLYPWVNEQYERDLNQKYIPTQSRVCDNSDTLCRALALYTCGSIGCIGSHRLILVHTEKGHVKYKHKPDKDRNRDTSLKETFEFPTLSPDERFLVFVSAFRGADEASSSSTALRCELNMVDIESGSITTLVSSDSGTPILSPIWSRYGNKIAYLSHEGITLVEPAGSVLWKDPIPGAAIEEPRSRACGWGGYIRFSENEDYIYVYARQQKPFPSNHFKSSNCGIMNVVTREFAWIDVPHVWPRHGIITSPRNFSGLDDTQKALVIGLFGSLENPVLNPSTTYDQRLYFYKTRREGFFPRVWIEGYSREKGESFHVLTTARGLYAE